MKSETQALPEGCSTLRASRGGCLAGRRWPATGTPPRGSGWGTQITDLGAKGPKAQPSIGACYTKERKKSLSRFGKAQGGRPLLAAGRRVEGFSQQGQDPKPCGLVPPAGLTEDEDVRAMLRGSRLCKIRSRTWHKERLYRLQEDGLSVWFQRSIPRAPSQHICEPGPGSRTVWYSAQARPAALTLRARLVPPHSPRAAHRGRPRGPPVRGPAALRRCLRAGTLPHHRLQGAPQKLGPGGAHSRGSTALGARPGQAARTPRRHEPARAPRPISCPGRGGPSPGVTGGQALSLEDPRSRRGMTLSLEGPYSETVPCLQNCGW